jgi:hypothetical protein
MDGTRGKDRKGDCDDVLTESGSSGGVRWDNDVEMEKTLDKQWGEGVQHGEPSVGVEIVKGDEHTAVRCDNPLAKNSDLIQSVGNAQTRGRTMAPPPDEEPKKDVSMMAADDIPLSQTPPGSPTHTKKLKTERDVVRRDRSISRTRSRYKL